MLFTVDSLLVIWVFIISFLISLLIFDNEFSTALISLSLFSKIDMLRFFSKNMFNIYKTYNGKSKVWTSKCLHLRSYGSTCIFQAQSELVTEI